MILHTDGESLPPLYAKWVAELLGGAIPRESRATCDTCAMCAGIQPESASKRYFFDPAVKCCSYLPVLPNFLVGRILLDRDPATQVGRGTVEKRIADAVGVTPLGLAKSPVFSLLYQNSSKAFGRSRTFRCPHYIDHGGGRCSIWHNRNSVCTTWFCKHIRGQVGHAFWRSLKDALEHVEKGLAHWCVLELQLGDDAMRHMVEDKAEGDAITGDVLDNKVDQKTYERIWGAWRGREHEFFGRCAELVSPLSWTDVLAICGPEVRMHARLAGESYRRLTSDDIPNALNVGPIEIVQMEGGATRVCTYSEHDPLDIPNAVMELLQHFDGRPTEEALAAIADERGIRLEPALVRKLVDFKVLVPADE